MSPAEVVSFLMNGTRTAKVATTMSSGQPHVMPVWFVLDGEELVSTTGAGSVKGRNLRRDPRIASVVDEDVAPYTFVHIRGRARISEDMDQLLRFATEIGGRHMGPDRAEEFGHRTAVAGELLVHVTPERTIAQTRGRLLTLAVSVADAAPGRTQQCRQQRDSVVMVSRVGYASTKAGLAARDSTRPRIRHKRARSAYQTDGSGRCSGR